ncbi:MAG TPA: CRISPR-associated endonuclease Cas2 [Opitutaceae bacterium]|nr:CRISPR-associated endonuclease Cas2 [Opitutaceae bacterium]
MLVLVSYDVSTTTPAGRRRLRHVARACLNHGQRVQNSVFECLLANDQWVAFRAELLTIADLEHDSLRFYFLGNEWQRRVEHHGTKPSIDPEGPLLV